MSSDEFRMKFKKKFWKMIILHSIVVVRLYSSSNQILSWAVRFIQPEPTTLFYSSMILWNEPESEIFMFSLFVED